MIDLFIQILQIITCLFMIVYFIVKIISENKSRKEIESICDYMQKRYEEKDVSSS